AAACPGRRDAGAAGRPDVGRPGALGAHPADLRVVRPQCLGDRPTAQDAPPHLAAHPVEARAAQLSSQRGGFTSTVTKFWFVDGRGSMSGPDSPPIGGLGEPSWAFEV